MGIALFTLNSLVAPLRSLAQWLMAGNRHRTSRLSHARPSIDAARSNVVTGHAHFRWAPAKLDAAGPAQKPLRVVRVVEACHGPSIAGRMVISGRMADVCAELDRLAALEAAHC